MIISFSFLLTVVYSVVRNRGTFGMVSVSWAVEPASTGDVSPTEGNITFMEGEHLKNFSLFSVPDEVRLSN